MIDRQVLADGLCNRKMNKHEEITTMNIEAKVATPGIYDLTDSVYHGDSYPKPCLSTGVIKDLLMKSPIHAKLNHPALNPDYCAECASKFDIGTAAHSILLQGVDNVCIIEAPDYRKSDAQVARDMARSNGKIPLLAKEYKRVRAMVDAAHRQLRDCELDVDLKFDGTAEQSFVWTEDDTWLKVKPDWIRHDNLLILDYKTTSLSANPSGIARIINTMGYDIQESLYKRGVYQLTGQAADFVFIFQEAIEPYLCSFIALSSQFTEMGNGKVDRGISLWRTCLESGEWPGYPTNVCLIDPPAWALTEWEMRELTEVA